MTPEPFDPLSFPASYANDVMQHVIDHNCAGCTVPTPESVDEFGSGGSCGVLAEIFIADTVADLTWDGPIVRCLRRSV